MILNAPALHSNSLASSPASLRNRRTIARDAQVRGIGFVSGADIEIRILPAPAGTGRLFRRVDLPDKPVVPAHVRHVLHSDRRTAIVNGSATVEMTEHLLAALAGLEIDDAIVEIDGPELPAGDGSSHCFTAAILAAGTLDHSTQIQPIVIHEPIAIVDGNSSIEIRPSENGEFVIDYELSYAHPSIGRQREIVRVDPETFAHEISPARTFVLESEVSMLRAAGIGTRQTARDLLVFGESGAVIDNCVRFVNECSRHKILDVVGDLALVGRPIVGRVIARRSGHRHNVALAAEILASDERAT